MSSKPRIIYFELSLKFYDREDARTFIHRLLKDELDFPFEYSKESFDTYEEYYVILREMCWASNLTRVATYLEGLECE